MRPKCGIAVDAAHSVKNLITEFRGINLTTGEELFYENLGNQTVNIGEFLAIVRAVKFIIEKHYEPKVVYSDSKTAITWFYNKTTASNKFSGDLKKAEAFLKICACEVDKVEVKHWNNAEWGETPADFGNK